MRETKPVRIANNAPPMRAAANSVAMEPVLNPPVLIVASKGTDCRNCAPTQSLIAPAMTWLSCCPSPPSTLAPAAQVTTPSAPDRPEEAEMVCQPNDHAFHDDPRCVPL